MVMWVSLVAGLKAERLFGMYSSRVKDVYLVRCRVKWFLSVVVFKFA